MKATAPTPSLDSAVLTVREVYFFLPLLPAQTRFAAFRFPVPPPVQLGNPWVQEAAFPGALLPQLSAATRSIRALWDLWAKLGKGHWATPPSYLPWWILCVLLHLSHVKGPTGERTKGYAVPDLRSSACDYFSCEKKSHWLYQSSRGLEIIPVNPRLGTV